MLTLKRRGPIASTRTHQMVTSAGVRYACALPSRPLWACGLAVLCASAAISPEVARAQARNDRYAALAQTELHSPFARVAEAVTPAVVAIRTRKMSTHGEMMQSNPLEDMFRQFFPRDREFLEREFEMPGAGSGFVVSADGYVLTNNHVVTDVDEIEVKLPTMEDYLPARMIGQDPSTDLAVIKIDGAKPLPYLEFGNSDDMKVGDWAIAIGNPLGRLEGSLTVGVLSAKGRFDLPIQGAAPRYQDFLQTDAAINPGNSGGPLLNIRGQVVGVNTAINASAQGIGFAIPINLVRRVYSDLVQHGHVVRGFLGVVMANLTPELAREHKVDRTHGVLVQEVSKDTPAQRAGVLVGDVILSFGGVPVANIRDLQFRVADAPVGSTATLRILRDGKERDVPVILAEYKEEEQLVASGNERRPTTLRPWMGMEVANLEDPHDPRVQELKDQFDIDQSSGVLVLAVNPGTPADRARVRPGDVIVEIGESSIEGLTEYNLATERLRDGRSPITLLIRRGDLTSYVTIEPAGDGSERRSN